ncbi:MAG: hypothetical protein C6H99_03400 [Epsilonproteobacteria bacterium]|nr:hypothetical protein [Campylobacterota bacterium]NPA64518.1 hypothetical protein [Campylobacterota bacterium]
MPIFVLLIFTLSLFGGWRESNITAIDTIIQTYESRLSCLQEHEAIPCIERHPQDPRSDALAKTFSMSFPKSYYKAKLRRDLAILKKQKLCFGKALTPQEAKACLSP